MGLTLLDASWALANRGGGRFDERVLMGATIPQAAAWVGGTAAGVVPPAGFDAEALGLDAVFPAFFLVLLASAPR